MSGPANSRVTPIVRRHRPGGRTGQRSRAASPAITIETHPPHVARTAARTRARGGSRGTAGRLRSSGRRAVLVTGRTFEELASHCPSMEVFDCIVLENGGALYSPAKRQMTVLCPPASLELARDLEQRGVEPILAGQAILATRRPYEVLVLEAIRDLGLELQIIFNGDAVMVLPSGVNKGSGLEAARREMGLSAHEVVGVGNAENDHSFLDICACAVAVDNAVAAIKAKVDFCTRGANGSGVAELIEDLVTTDLAGRAPRKPGDHRCFGGSP
jgi:HAD superfamily hydrolase (TIGR01484 family)